MIPSTLDMEPSTVNPRQKDRKRYKCPTVGPGSSYKNSMVGLKKVCNFLACEQTSSILQISQKKSGEKMSVNRCRQSCSAKHSLFVFFSDSVDKQPHSAVSCPQRMRFSGKSFLRFIHQSQHRKLFMATNEKLSPTFRGNENTINDNDSQTSLLPIFSEGRIEDVCTPVSKFPTHPNSIFL